MVSSYQRSTSTTSSSLTEPIPLTSVTSSSGSAVTPRSTSRRNQSNNSTGSSNRLCAHCRNHGLRVPVRGHKRYCAYRLCSCKDCRLVRERQRVVALHLYVRRAQEQEEEAAAAREAAALKSSSPDGSTSQLALIQEATSSNSQRAAEAACAETRERMLYQSLLDLRRSFPVSEAGLPLLLCILKNSRSVHEATAKIVQGTHEASIGGLLASLDLIRPSLYM